METRVIQAVGLTAELGWDWRTVGGRKTYGRVVSLTFGDAEIACWPVDDRVSEFTPKPGDNWTRADYDAAERRWVSHFVAEKFREINLFAGLEGRK